MTNEEIFKLVLETSGVKGLEELATQAYDTAKALDKVAEKASDVKKETIDLQAIGAKGQGIFSAFQAGELPSIIKGVGELADLVPGLNAFAPAIRKIGDVSEVAWPMLKKFYATMTDDANLPIVTKAVTEYGSRLDAAGDSVKNLTDRTEELAAAEAKEGKALAEEVKQRQILAGLEAQGEEKDTTEKERKERAANLTFGLGGQQEEVVEAVAKGMAEEQRQKLQAKRDALQDKIADPNTPWADKPAMTAEFNDLRKQLRDMQGRIPADIQGRARTGVAKAIVGGDEDATRTAIEYMKGQGPKVDKFRLAMDETLPENTQGDDEAEAAIQAGNERAHESRMKREENARIAKKAAEKKAIEDKKVDELNATGEENERAGVRGDLDAREAEARKKMVGDEQGRKRRGGLNKDLGDRFLAEAERATIAAKPRDRKATAERIRAAAQHRKLQQGGMSPADAFNAAADVKDTINEDIIRQLGLLGKQGKGAKGLQNLYDALGQAIQNQAMIAELDAIHGEQLKQQAQQAGGQIQTNRSQASNGTF